MQNNESIIEQLLSLPDDGGQIAVNRVVQCSLDDKRAGTLLIALHNNVEEEASLNDVLTAIMYTEVLTSIDAGSEGLPLEMPETDVTKILTSMGITDRLDQLSVLSSARWWLILMAATVYEDENGQEG